MITKDYFEKQLKKHGKITVYSSDNIPLTISTESYLCNEDSNSVTFDMDCEDMVDYCKRLGLCLGRTNND